MGGDLEDWGWSPIEESEEDEEVEGEDVGEKVGGANGDFLMGCSAMRKSARCGLVWTLRQRVRRKWISFEASGL